MSAILAGDIGGTKTLLALYRLGPAPRHRPRHGQTGGRRGRGFPAQKGAHHRLKGAPVGRDVALAALELQFPGRA